MLRLMVFLIFLFLSGLVSGVKIPTLKAAEQAVTAHLENIERNTIKTIKVQINETEIT